MWWVNWALWLAEPGSSASPCPWDLVETVLGGIGSSMWLKTVEVTPQKKRAGRQGAGQTAECEAEWNECQNREAAKED